MKILNITWLGDCERCESPEDKPHKVETERGTGARLYDGDKVTCQECQNTGVISCDDGVAFVEWSEEQE